MEWTHLAYNGIQLQEVVETGHGPQFRRNNGLRKIIPQAGGLAVSLREHCEGLQSLERGPPSVIKYNFLQLYIYFVFKLLWMSQFLERLITDGVNDETTQAGNSRRLAYMRQTKSSAVSVTFSRQLTPDTASQLTSGVLWPRCIEPINNPAPPRA